MSAEANRAIYLRVVEDLNEGDLESSLAFTAPDATLNGQPLGREGDWHRAEILAAAFPDHATTYWSWSQKGTCWWCAGG